MQGKKFMERNPELRVLIESMDHGELRFGLRVATEKVMTYYHDYAVGLPDESAWKHGKVEHVTHGTEAIREYSTRFDLVGIEIDVVAFPLVAHDTGRLIHEHVQRATGKMLPWRHGEESALLAAEALGGIGKTPIGRAMLLAIKHHSDMVTPTIEQLGGSKAAFALTGIVRDFDKMTSFDDASKYTNVEEFKQKKILTSFSTQRKDDPTFGDEKGSIQPAEHLETFLAGKALERRRCASYEAYMLQYLAWCFDIQNEEILELCVAKGGPKIVFTYLLGQLEAGSPEQYRKLDAWAKTWKDGLLVR
jgi:hypothetical protein